MADVRLVGEQNWRRLPADRFGMMNILDGCIADLDSLTPPRLPSFRDSSELLMASDYGGQHAGAQYQSYSYLLVSRDHLSEWIAAQRNVRSRWLPDGRRLSYKSLSDGVRANALLPFLEAANLMNGVLLTVAINTEFKSLFTRQGHILHTSTLLADYQHWRPKPFERLYRIVALAGFLLSGLSHPGQNVSWVTDEDEIVASGRHLGDFGKFFSRALLQYVPHRLGRISVTTTARPKDATGAILEDLVSIPDLAAGAVAAFLTGTPASRNVIPLARPLPDDISPKTLAICSWMSAVMYPLKRIVIAVDPLPGGTTYCVRWIQFVPLALDVPSQ